MTAHPPFVVLRGVVSAALVSAGLLGLADGLGPASGELRVDGLADRALLDRFGPYRPDQGYRPAEEGAEVRLGGFAASAQVELELDLATRLPQPVTVTAQGRPAASLRVSGRTRAGARAVADADGRVSLGLVGQGETAIRLFGVRAVSPRPGLPPVGRLALYALFGALLALTVPPGLPPAARTLLLAAAVGGALTAVAGARLHAAAWLPVATAGLGLAAATRGALHSLQRLDWAPLPARLVVAATLLRVVLVSSDSFPCIDLTFHVHHLWGFVRGDVMASRAPGPGEAIPVPYPPAFYALLAPFATFEHREDARLVRLALVTLETAGLGLTYVLARGVGASAPAAQAAVATLASMPEGLLVLAKGIAANVAGHALGLLATAALVLRAPPVLLVLLLAGAFLGHLGAALTLSLFLAAWTGLAWRRGEVSGRRAAGLALLAASAAVLAWVVYYRLVSDVVAAGVARWSSRLHGEENAFFGLRAVRLGKIAQDLLLKFGGGPVLLAAWGLRTAMPAPLRTLLHAWLATGLALAVVAVTTAVPLRFEYFLGPAVALAAGVAAERAGEEGRSRAVALALGGALAVQAAIGVLLALHRFPLVSVILESPRWEFPFSLREVP